MDNELDEGKVEKARAAFEAMTKAMLDAGRRYEARTTAALSAALNADRTATDETCDHDHDDGLGMLTARATLTAAGVPALLAEVERLRAEVAAGIETERGSSATGRRLLAEARTRATSAEQERDEFERRYATVLRNLNVAQQERDRLRAGIEALAERWEPSGLAVARDLRSLLAGSGEQPGKAEVRESVARGIEQSARGETVDLGDFTQYARPAPVVPDSPDVLRERVRRAVKRAATWTEDGPEYEEAPDAGMVEKITDAVWDVRPTGQEGERCGAWGGCTLPRGHNRGRADVPSNHSVPDSPDVYEVVRAFIEEEVGFDGGPGMDDQARRLTDRVLAVVGQGVTAGERRYSAGDPDPTPDDSETPCEAQRDGFVCTWPANHDHPQHVAGAGDEIAAVWDVRPTGQEQDCNCGFGGQHDPGNPRCRVNDPTEAWLRSGEQEGE